MLKIISIYSIEFSQSTNLFSVNHIPLPPSRVHYEVTLNNQMMHIYFTGGKKVEGLITLNVFLL